MKSMCQVLDNLKDIKRVTKKLSHYNGQITLEVATQDTREINKTIHVMDVYKIVTVAKSRFSEIGTNGDAVLNELINKGILQNVSSMEVRLTPNAVLNEDTIQKIAKGDFDKIWTILQELAHKPILLFSERLPQQERIFFDAEGLHEVYSQSMDINSEPGETIKIGNELTYNVTGIYDFVPEASNKENGTGIYVSLRGIPKNDGYQPIRLSTFGDEGIKKDKTGFVKLSYPLSANITSEDILKQVKESGVYLLTDDYTYNQDNGEVKGRKITLTANGVSNDGWTIADGQITPAMQLNHDNKIDNFVANLMKNEEIRKAFEKNGVIDSILRGAVVTMFPQEKDSGVITTDYRINGDILQGKQITVREEAGRVIGFIVGLEFNNNGDQTLAYSLTPDYQVSGFLKTTGTKTAESLFTKDVVDSFVKAMDSRIPGYMDTFGKDKSNEDKFWTMMALESIGRKTQLTEILEYPKTIEGQGAVGRYSDNNYGKAKYHYLLPKDGRGRDAAVSYASVNGPDGKGKLEIQLWMLEGRQDISARFNGDKNPIAVVFPVGQRPGSITVDQDNFKGKAEVQLIQKEKLDGQAIKTASAVAVPKVEILQPTFDAQKGPQPIQGKLAAWVDYISANEIKVTYDDHYSVVGYRYPIMDSDKKVSQYFTLGGQLLAEGYSRITAQPLLNLFHSLYSVWGDEIVIMDVRKPIRTPIASFWTVENNGKYAVLKYFDNDKTSYEIQSENVQRMTIVGKEVLVNVDQRSEVYSWDAPGLDEREFSKFQEKYTPYLNGELMIKIGQSVPDQFLKWGRDYITWANLVTYVGSVFWLVILIGKFLGWGSRIRELVQRWTGGKNKEDSSLTKDVVLILSREKIKELVREIGNYPEYGFQYGIVKQAKKLLKRELLSQINSGKSEEEFIEFVFRDYKNT